VCRPCASPVFRFPRIWPSHPLFCLYPLLHLCFSYLNTFFVTGHPPPEVIFSVPLVSSKFQDHCPVRLAPLPFFGTLYGVPLQFFSQGAYGSQFAHNTFLLDTELTLSPSPCELGPWGKRQFKPFLYPVVGRLHAKYVRRRFFGVVFFSTAHCFPSASFPPVCCLPFLTPLLFPPGIFRGSVLASRIPVQLETARRPLPFLHLFAQSRCTTHSETRKNSPAP